jgi:type 1 glutamine amidotransferase
MKFKIHFTRFLLMTALIINFTWIQAKPIRVLVITGGHSYQEEPFNQMFAGLGKGISFKVVSFPEAFTMFSPEKRDQYDVLVFYHMWQKITEDEAKNFSECIRGGKPLVVLHHSICAFDDWPEYISIIGGKYFHKPTVVNGKEYPVCTYKHDLTFTVKVVDSTHPVTKGLREFEVLDETYSGYYVDPGVKTLLTTTETSSTPVIGWTKKYGKAQVVSLQSGHDANTFGNPDFRRLLRQAILWVVKETE